MMTKHGQEHGQGKGGEQEDPLDEMRVALQNTVTDLGTRVSEIFPFAGGLRAGRTDFEGHKLNDMIDMLEGTDHGALDHAGERLFQARNAIHDAAQELDTNIGAIDYSDWAGEAAENFRTWSKNLVKNTKSLGDFADVAAVQIQSAGTGLASVRGSMPPRDERPDPKTVDQIPAPKRVEGNKEYDEAVQVENHRQEAINQMNRLSSFYAVSEETLAGLEPPSFEAMPDVGVPKPSPTGGTGDHVVNPYSGAERNRVEPTPEAQNRRVDSQGTVRPPVYVDGTVTDPQQPVGTEIDSVSAPPAPTQPPPVATQPTSTSTGPAVPPPVFGGPPSAGPTGLNGPVKAIGKSGPPYSRSNPQARGSVPDGETKPAAQRPGNGLGRPSPTAQGSGRGNSTGRPPMGRTSNPMGRSANTSQTATSRGGATSGRPPTGRAGNAAGRQAGGQGTGRGPVSGGRPVSGGNPRPAKGTGIPRGGPASASGVGRSGGVVGGKPSGTPTNNTPGARVPKGNVIGGRPPANTRTPGAGGNFGGHGVIGSQEPENGRGQVPRSTANSDGVVGKPQGRVPGTGTGHGAFPPGGHGPGIRQNDQDKQKQDRNQQGESGDQPQQPR